MSTNDVEVGPRHSPLPVLSAPESLAEGVYRSLVEAITNGSLAPGYHLREIPLAQHFGVSTTPVREALRRLEREGLVEINPRRGAVVPAFGRREIEELFEAKETLERRAVRRAAEAPRREFVVIEALLEESAGLRDDPDQSRFLRVDLRLHRAINDLGGNRYIADLIEQMQRQVQLIRARYSVSLQGRSAVAHKQHQALLAAIRERQADRAEEIIRGHIRGIREAVLRAVDDSTPGGVVGLVDSTSMGASNGPRDSSAVPSASRSPDHTAPTAGVHRGARTRGESAAGAMERGETLDLPRRQQGGR